MVRHIQPVRRVLLGVAMAGLLAFGAKQVSADGCYVEKYCGGDCYVWCECYTEGNCSTFSSPGLGGCHYECGGVGGTGNEYCNQHCGPIPE